MISGVNNTHPTTRLEITPLGEVGAGLLEQDVDIKRAAQSRRSQKETAMAQIQQTQEIEQDQIEASEATMETNQCQTCGDACACVDCRCEA